MAAPVAGVILSGTHSPTVAAPLTAQGALVGTFQYMAPEQLEGREVDARADLWALGCVLYEMATAKRAFEGRSQASLISAILTSEPPPLSQIAPMSPPALDRLVAACLAKDPADRVQSAHDVKLQLQWMGEPASQSGVSQVGLPTSPMAKRSNWLVPLSLAVGAIGLATASYFALRPRAVEPFTVLELPRPFDMQFDTRSFGGAISPDGRSVIALGRRGEGSPSLWRWSLDSPEPVEIPGTVFPWFLEWSPDSREIAFTDARVDGLFRVTAAGGTPVRLCSVSDPRGVAWGAKDVLVFAPTASGPLSRVAATAGTPEPATTLDASRGEAGHRYPCFLPDGEHFLYTVFPPSPQGYPIRMGRLGSMETELIMHAESAPTFVAPSWLVFAQSGQIVAQRFDLARRRLIGQPHAIAAAPRSSGMTAEPIASAAADGTLLHLATPRQRARLEWWDRTGALVRAIELPQSDWELVSLAPDQRNAVARSDGDLWAVDLERASARRLLRDAEFDLQVAWSVDSRRAACTSREHGRPVIVVFDLLAGAASDTLRTLDALFLEPLDWSPDGTTLLVAALGAGSVHGTSWDLWTMPLDGSGPAPYLQSEAVERYARFSPDGRTVVLGSLAAEQGEWALLSYPRPDRRVQLFTQESQWLSVVRATWEPSGRGVILADVPGVVWRVSLSESGGHLVPAEEQRLFEAPNEVTGLDTRDGDRFLVSRSIGDPVSPSLRLLRGWQNLARR